MPRNGPQVFLAALGIMVSLAGLVSGLIGAYVGLQNRALLAEVRKEMAELEHRIVLRINGAYVRSREHQLGMEALDRRLDSLEHELRLAAKESRRCLALFDSQRQAANRSRVSSITATQPLCSSSSRDGRLASKSVT